MKEINEMNRLSNTENEISLDELEAVTGGSLPSSTIKRIYDFINSGDLGDSVRKMADQGLDPDTIKNNIKSFDLVNDNSVMSSVFNKVPDIWNKVEQAIDDVLTNIFG